MDKKELNALIIKGNKEEGGEVAVYAEFKGKGLTVGTEDGVINEYGKPINIDNIMNGGDPMKTFEIDNISYYYDEKDLKEIYVKRTTYAGKESAQIGSEIKIYEDKKLEAMVQRDTAISNLKFYEEKMTALRQERNEADRNEFKIK